MRYITCFVLFGLISCKSKDAVESNGAYNSRQRNIVLILPRGDARDEFLLSRREVERLDLDRNGINGDDKFPNSERGKQAPTSVYSDPHPNPLYPRIIGSLSEFDAKSGRLGVIVLITESRVPLNIWWEDIYSDEFKAELARLIDSKIYKDVNPHANQ